MTNEELDHLERDIRQILTETCRGEIHVATAGILALITAARRPAISTPDIPGQFEGDIWFGHPIKRNMGTHRWEGNMWKELPSEEEALMRLLAEARTRITTIVAQRDSALEALKPFAEAMNDTVDAGVIGDHINAWESPMAMSVTYGHFRAAYCAYLAFGPRSGS